MYTSNYSKTRVALPIREERINNKKVKYVEIGAEDFYRPSIILWIKDDDLIEFDGYLKFPIKNVDIEKINEKNLVLSKGDKHLYYLKINAPYKGKSLILTKNETCYYYNNTESSKLFKFKEYRSKRGRLGIADGALILTKEKEEIKIEWTRKKIEEEQEEEEREIEKGITTINKEGEIIEEIVEEIITTKN